MAYAETNNYIYIMKKLDKEIKKNGFTYKQIERNPTTALYAQYTNAGQLAGHEVFHIKTIKERIMFGMVIPAHEKFPADRDFGITAWSVGIDKTRALKRFKEISNFAKKGEN